MSLPLPKKDYVAINIKDSSVSYPPNSKLFCNLCNCKLVLFDVQAESWYCNRCNVFYYPNKGERIIRDQIAECRKYNLNVEDRMTVVPVPFSIEGAKMLQHAKWLMEETEQDETSLIAIDKDRFHKLITSLRTAVANEYKLDKETSWIKRSQVLTISSMPLDYH